jgi:hypothetical protein
MTDAPTNPIVQSKPVDARQSEWGAIVHVLNGCVRPPRFVPSPKILQRSPS